MRVQYIQDGHYVVRLKKIDTANVPPCLAHMTSNESVLKNMLSDLYQSVQIKTLILLNWMGVHEYLSCFNLTVTLLFSIQSKL